MIVELFHPRRYTIDCRCAGGRRGRHQSGCTVGHVVEADTGIAFGEAILGEAEYGALRRLQTAGLIPAPAHAA